MNEFRPMVPDLKVMRRKDQKPEYVVDENGCWVWQRATDSAGYGKVSRSGKWYGAHVMFWERFNGPIPVGLEPDHAVCDRRDCVNPAHMELVTRAVNVKRGWDKGGSERREREHANRSAGQYRRWRRSRDLAVGIRRPGADEE